MFASKKDIPLLNTTTNLRNYYLIISLLSLAIVTPYAQNANTAPWPLDSFSKAAHTFEETLQIFHDKKGNTPFEVIKGKGELFSADNTIENFQADQVYWAKLNLRGHSQKAANYLFGFSTIRWGAGWQYNDAWLVRADGSVIQQQSGFGLSKQEKSIPSAANLARFEIKQNELVTLYVRYKGAMKDKKRRPKRINLSLLKEAMHPTLFEGYPFKGHFSSKHLFERIPFDVNFFINQEIYVDASGTVNIDSIAKNWNQLDWKDVYSTKPVSNQVYWIKTRFYGSPYFNGEQTLYTPYRYGFDYVDAYWADGNDSYIHQRTGDKVSLEERPFNFWANFIKLDLSPIDTIDLFIRMEGLDPNYLTHQIALGHVDPSELFPNQVKEAWENGIFYGILSIQGIFFFLLFLIERERIHLYFVLFVLGLFFVFGFSSDNYFMFVPFPEGKNISATLMILGFFLCEVGFLKFTETYFNYAKASFISRWFIPVFIIIAAIGNLNAWWNYKMTVDYYYYAIREPAFLFALLLILISLVTGLVMAFIAPQQKNVSKKVFLLAFLPLLISSIFMNGHFLLVHFLLDPYILDLPYNGFDIYRIAIIAMLTLLAVSIGYRTNRLKADKAAALQKNLADQQKMLAEQKQINQAISRFVPNEFLAALGKTNITQINLGDNTEKEVTVFFSDIRSYTSLSEQMTPSENFRFVNAYNARMGPIIQQKNGFVNQYLGDGIMAIFPDSPTDALWAAIQMQQILQNYNQQRIQEGKKAIQVGMGMHTGSLIMGITGDKNRLDATTISDSVNSASRIENLTKYYGANILLSEACLKKMDDQTTFKLRYLGQVQVKGKQEALKIYECFDGDLPEMIDLKLATLADFEKGVELYFKQTFNEAHSIFKNVLRQHPADLTAKLFLTKAKWLMETEVTEDWTGVELMEKQ